jgi:protein-disulfide isomerase
MRIRRLSHLLTLIVLGAGAVGCRREPDVEQLQRALLAHPEIVYAVIRAHPADFIRVVDSAADQARAQLRADAEVTMQNQIRDGLLHPHTVPLDHRVALGNPSAPITVVEYSDFQCPFCRGERSVLVDLLEKYPARVRLVVKHTPLDIHPMARPAARLFEAIARRDPMAAYRFYDDLFEHQDMLNRDGAAFLAQAARRALGDDAPARAALHDADSQSIEAVVRADEEEGRRLGFTGTPGFLIDGVPIQGAIPLSVFETIINRTRVAPAAEQPATRSEQPLSAHPSCSAGSCPRRESH